ncbi:MAG: glycosyltransferase family 2 protein [Gammaproteobacteria bacterium]|nr:glycosyltransferase family 2 protein [Gammaproteobacteria bacterium]
MKPGIVSIVIPILNEGPHLERLLVSLQCFRQEGHEVILVDGGSMGGIPHQNLPMVDKGIVSPPGRAFQMNAGAKEARGEVLWFLHADSEVPEDAAEMIVSVLGAGKRCWGRFDIALSGRLKMLRVVEFMMNLRSRVTGIATGDQGIFVLNRAFLEVGGFPEIPLMEDISISRALKKCSSPHCFRQRLVTSSRRWERDGVFPTITLMWRLRLAFALGADPHTLEKKYYRCSSPTHES